MAEDHLIALRATAVLSIILWFKVFVSNMTEGLTRLNAGARTPEDDQANSEDVTPEHVEAQKRAERIVSNDLENIPYVMALAWGSMFCIFFGDDGDFRDGQATAQTVLFAVFTVARILHSIIYWKGLAKPRTAAFLIGVASSIGIGINGAIAAFQVSL